MPRGGARPGAGRKKKTSVDEQSLRRELVHEIFTPDEWRDLLRHWLAAGKATPAVIFPLLPYLMGSSKQEINVSGKVEHTLTISDIRKAIGIESS